MELVAAGHSDGGGGFEPTVWMNERPNDLILSSVEMIEEWSMEKKQQQRVWLFLQCKKWTKEINKIIRVSRRARFREERSQWHARRVTSSPGADKTRKDAFRAPPGHFQSAAEAPLSKVLNSQCYAHTGLCNEPTPAPSPCPRKGYSGQEKERKRKNTAYLAEFAALAKSPMTYKMDDCVLNKYIYYNNSGN